MTLAAPLRTVPSAPRRGDGPRCGARRAALVALALAGAWATAQAPADAAPVACGDLAGVGLLADGGLRPDGTLAATWTLIAAPTGTLVQRPLVFVDGRLVADLGPVAFPCGQPVALELRDLAPAHAVHWVLHGWPPVPSDLMPLGFDEARAAYAGRFPPGTFALADVGFARPAGGLPASGAPVRTRPMPPGALVDDRVEVPAEDLDPSGVDGAGGADRWVRAPVGADLPIRIVYEAPDDAAVLATCLLDGEQVAAFDGAVVRPAHLSAGGLLEVDGRVRVAAPGWHRLHCLLLPDAADGGADHPPRPLLALYLWGEGP
ncbi:MAG: hypothetical protein P1P87_09335 [Trueperaceae bacterium]|nr:hypothetical protein [Trueperaceae bacterium]